MRPGPRGGVRGPTALAAERPPAAPRPPREAPDPPRRAPGAHADPPAFSELLSAQPTHPNLQVRLRWGLCQAARPQARGPRGASYKFGPKGPNFVQQTA